MQEIWKPVNNYDGYYEVSNLGKIRNTKTGHILKPSVNEFGYEYVTLFKGKSKSHLRVHRILAMAFIDNPHGKTQINHIDHNKRNNSLDNLEWVTPLENVEHEIKNNKTRTSQLRSNNYYRRGKIQLTLLITPEMNEKLKTIAGDTGKSRTRIIREAVSKYLSEDGT